MGDNIRSWTREALGTELTIQQFLDKPEAQEATFEHMFGKFVKQYGSPANAASVWFTGKPMSEAKGRSDKNITMETYVNRFLKLSQGDVEQEFATFDGQPI